MVVAKSSKTKNLFLIILINFMWATQVPVIRLMGNDLGPVTIAFVPMICSTIFFIPFLWFENKKRKDRKPRSWKDMAYFILPGLVGIFIMQYAYTLGSTMTLAANAGIITLTIPVLVAVFASVFLGEKFNIIRVIGFFIAIAGVLLTSLSDVKNARLGEGKYFKGNMIFLFACCCCAFYNTYCKLLVDKGYTELEILVYSSLIGSVASLPLLIWVEPFHITMILHSSTTIILGLLELSFVVYGISMILFFYVLKDMDVTQAILGNYLLPFFISLLGVILLKEEITGVMFAGGFIIFIGTLMVTVYENQLLEFFTKRKALKDGKIKT
ncbi:MAG: DMT family transporter [Bacteroidetes bacterium]|nr:DMT family transporter [Bacteroidota bacterium]